VFIDSIDLTIAADPRTEHSFSVILQQQIDFPEEETR